MITDVAGSLARALLEPGQDGAAIDA